MGLSGNWTIASGSILGEGGSSKANFKGALFLEELGAYSCALGQPIAGPVVCPSLETLPTLSGSTVNFDPTGESSNLNANPLNFECTQSDCILVSFLASPP
jgi:hypothetical protein